jgi:hypothetical protein
MWWTASVRGTGRTSLKSTDLVGVYVVPITGSIDSVHPVGGDEGRLPDRSALTTHGVV